VTPAAPPTQVAARSIRVGDQLFDRTERHTRYAWRRVGAVRALSGTLLLIETVGGTTFGYHRSATPHEGVSVMRRAETGDPALT
jgi:hypothetical protein